MSLHIVAVGQDAYWLTAVEKATTGWAGAATKTIECPEDLANCLSTLPKADAKALLLVDASGQCSMESIVTMLRSHGWKYIIVVAADPSAKEAISILRRNLGYDYWEKTYDENDIRERVRASFDEIESEELTKKRKRDRTGRLRQRFE